jgi:hypothetical protein
VLVLVQQMFLVQVLELVQRMSLGQALVLEQQSWTSLPSFQCGLESQS